MSGPRDTPAPPPGVLASARESDLVLREFAQRTYEEFAAAIGSLRLVIAAKGSRTRWRLLAEALGRLEGAADLHRLLASSTTRVRDVATDLDALCRSIGSARPNARRSVMTLSLPPTPVPGVVARRLCVVAADLVADGVERALDGRAGRLSVSLSSSRRGVALRVSDDRPSGAVSGRADRRGELVRNLVELAGGTMEVRFGPRGASARVTLPFDEGQPIGADEAL